MADSDVKIPKDIAKLSFEQALEQLENIVRDLEGGDGDLEQSIEGYARGALLKRHCEAKLKDAQARIDKIVTGSADDSGAIATEPLDGV